MRSSESFRHAVPLGLAGKAIDERPKDGPTQHGDDEQMKGGDALKDTAESIVGQGLHRGDQPAKAHSAQAGADTYNEGGQHNNGRLGHRLAIQPLREESPPSPGQALSKSVERRGQGHVRSIIASCVPIS
ncbi:MAG: hypothetical protein P8189_17455 [Anaerolineae bacterium]